MKSDDERREQPREARRGVPGPGARPPFVLILNCIVLNSKHIYYYIYIYILNSIILKYFKMCVYIYIYTLNSIMTYNIMYQVLLGYMTMLYNFTTYDIYSITLYIYIYT